MIRIVLCRQLHKPNVKNVRLRCEKTPVPPRLSGKVTCVGQPRRPAGPKCAASIRLPRETEGAKR